MKNRGRDGRHLILGRGGRAPESRTPGLYENKSKRGGGVGGASQNEEFE